MFIQYVKEGVKQNTRKAWLVSLGVVSVFEEKSSSLLSNLVNKGEKVDLNDKLPLDTVKGGYKKVQSKVSNVSGKSEVMLQSMVNKGLHLAGFPTKEEVNELTKKVESLMKSIDKLAKVKKTETKVVKPVAAIKAAPVKKAPVAKKTTKKAADIKK